ncbi:MAG: glycosyltransferase family 2 protein [Planctomycetota bacterium]
MPSLSVAIVCKNNEATIGRTLEAFAGIADEIVAVDSGSTDGTLDLLRQHNARVIETEWKGYIGTKRFALEHCTKDWVFSVDSDESPEPELRETIRAAVAEPRPGVGGYEINRKVFYAGRFLEHCWQPEWRLRLCRRELADWGGHEPHDVMCLKRGASERVERLRGDLRHDSFVSIAEHLRTQARHSETGADALLAMGKRGSHLRLVVSPPWAFCKQVVLRGGWRDGWRGCAAGASAAAGALMKHAILLERSRLRDEAKE